uniref:Specific RNA polymerase II transcription factor n=1 Tax=Kwoniella dejecticola CBS 10117 TaxID=1296121 RepID=A0A1A5ZYP9_9TREE|nr:specific RNA polymerase II transcription factor [Kwoniella dejecticola CBS 10117]OBR82927.1 specific RNA polymerase II transcription factor [Kwoniella dejecticola CBS 10117]
MADNHFTGLTQSSQNRSESNGQNNNNNNITHPPSRLSPPPGTDIVKLLVQRSAVLHDSSAHPGGQNNNMSLAGNGIPQTQPGTSGIGSSSTAAAGPSNTTTTDGKKKKDDKDGNVPKRGYRACVHCRLRKARCDLGDVNAPSEPPCSRCRREQRDCVFLPSKRRRKGSAAAEGGPGDTSVDTTHPQAEVYPAHGPSSTPSTSTASQNNPASVQSITQSPFETKPSQWSDIHINNNNQSSVGPSTHGITNNSNAQMLPPGAHTSVTPQNNPDTTTPGSLGESSVTSGHSPGHRSKKRRTVEPDGTRKIVNASLSNEMDALEILANAATDENGDNDLSLGGSKSKHHGHGHSRSMNGENKRVSWDISEETSPVRKLGEFHLIKSGILDENTLQELVTIYFRDHHPSLPVFQTARIPRTRDQLLDLAHKDSFLLTCIVAVASRHPVDPKYRDIHDKTWPILREIMADYSFAGLPGSVGFVEGVLLLAEHLPREKATPPKPASLDMLAGPGTEAAGEHGTDNRRSWSLTGLAIRAAYLLGLDQIALEINEDERTPDVERARSVWTWCYLYDRTIDEFRLAFWSRGPSLCFVGYSHISQTGEAAARMNFPLQLSPGSESENNDGDPSSSTSHDDSASLMQALVELTQIMTNAHDILYPSKSRTAVLVRQGEYFLFLDHFRRALDSYRTIWKPKKWSNQTLQELSWMTYQFVRLYISSFGYSAHVKRAQWRAEAEAQAGRDGARQPVQLFPRGSATSPDAIYIYESIGSANEIMAIALRLSQMGSLRYLPSRYLINISYAAVFALKSSYSGAVTGKDVTRIRELVDHVCAALVLACPEKDHPANKYGQMLRMLSKKLEQLSDASAVPSRFPSPEPTSSTPLPTNSHTYSEPTPLPWTLPAETMDTQPMPFQFPPFEFNLLPSQNTNNQNTNSTTPTYQPSNSAAAIPIPPIPSGDYVANLGLGLGAASANIPRNSIDDILGVGGPQGQNQNQNPENLFDFDTNFDFDLKGFWDDFTLGEGSGFPFR